MLSSLVLKPCWGTNDECENGPEPWNSRSYHKTESCPWFGCRDTVAAIRCLLLWMKEIDGEGCQCNARLHHAFKHYFTYRTPNTLKKRTSWANTTSSFRSAAVPPTSPVRAASSITRAASSMRIDIKCWINHFMLIIKSNVVGTRTTTHLFTKSFRTITWTILPIRDA